MCQREPGWGPVALVGVPCWVDFRRRQKGKTTKWQWWFQQDRSLDSRSVMDHIKFGSPAMEDRVFGDPRPLSPALDHR